MMFYPVAEIEGVTLLLSGFGFAEFETCLKWIANEAPAYLGVADCKVR